jgi:beta-glucosidase
VEKPSKKGTFTKENTIMEMKDYSFVMKLMYLGVEIFMAKNNGGKDYSDPSFKMMMSTATDGSISCMHINGGIKGKLLEGLVEIANGRFFKGLKMMLSK